MEADGYEQMRRAFEEESERLSCEIARHTAHIGEWEEQMTHKIMDDATLSDEQKMRKMQEEVYGKLDEMYRQAEGSKEYRKAIAEHQKFMRENELMRDSTLYNLKRTSPECLPFVDEVIRGRYRFEAGLCALNQVGSAASDFAFSDRDGRVSNLHGIDADYVIMFFSNPGCEACRQIIGQLVSSPMDASGHSLTELIAAGRIAVLNIYIDSDIEAWKDYSSSYPSDWHNGYDPYGILRDNALYAVRAIPSLYLLDSEKRVLFKDAVPEKVIAYLQGVL